MNLSNYLHHIRRGWLIIVLSTLAGGGVAYGLSKAVTPTYQSQASVYFAPRSVTSGNDLAQSGTFTRDQMLSYAALATEPVVLDPVIEDLGLDSSPAALAGRIATTSPKNTVVLRITAMDSDPEQAAKIANATARHLSAAAVGLAPKTNGKPTIAAEQIASAIPSKAPTSPNTKRNATAGLLAGLFLGVLLALAWGQLDPRVRTTRSLARAVNVPVLGEIPRQRTPKRKGAGSPSFTAEALEPYRRLWANLSTLQRDSPSHALLVTSSATHHGTTAAAVNIAAAAEESGAKTLVLDATLHQHGHQSESPPPSTAPPADVLRSLGQRYDLVVIDAPAALTDSAPLLLAPHCAGVLLVADSARSRRHRLLETLRELGRLDAPIVGVVLSRVGR